MKTSVVYWCNNSIAERYTTQSLIHKPPYPLRKNIMDKVMPGRNPNTGYDSCKSMHNIFANTFMLDHPMNLQWSKGDPNGIFIDRSHDSFFKDSIMLDVDFQWLFFSEDDIELELTPAYMHKALSNDYGYLTAGSLNISKWFRAINTTYQLWDGVTEMKIKQDDPMMYLNFRTPNKVILKQFVMTDKLRHMADATANFKSIFPMQPLENLYERFTRSNQHKLVLKEIRNNLLD